MKFVLDHVADIDRLSKLNGYHHADRDLVFSALDEGARFVQDLVAPLNRIGDQVGSQLDGAGGVATPAGFADAYAAYVEAGWGGVDFPAAWGGHGMPKVVGMAFEEMLTSANMAFSLCPLLTFGGVDAIIAHGSEEQQATYLPKLISGEWSATMNLTEPQAGSDVGAITTKAEPNDDGSYRITGSKIFITWGEHDMNENIVHLVLARTPDAPPGTKGISMFIVPKYLPDDDGSPGSRNDVKVVSIEHKLGIHGSPTCVMSFGEAGGATGWILGEENRGMRNMFTMMNAARISVGLEGMAIAERAYQDAREYARERRQGRAIGAEPGVMSPIIEHPDVRRMLLTMRANIEAMRSLLYATATSEDLAEYAADADVRHWHHNAVALLTPIVKAWSTDLGVEMTSLAVQVFGGMGFVEESGAAQHYRDARIAPIYEGTNGIQAIDLVMRKLPLDGGEFVRGFIDDMERVVTDLGGLDGYAEAAANLTDAVSVLRTATTWLLEHRSDPNDALAGATPYCRLFGIVAGGWQMARAAVVADEEGLAEKSVVARFYLEQILPQAQGLLAAATRPSGALFALSADQF